MTKAALRKIYLEKQKNLSALEREEKSRRIADLFFENFDFDRIKFLHCFLPIEKFNEVDTRIILEKIRRNFPQIEIVVPRVNSQIGEIENLRYTLETKLTASFWGIDEPTHDETIEAEKIDLVLVPLLCFDEKGFRVGYGKGFYDKFLKNCRADCLKIGLSYFPPIAEISDVHNFDVKLDFCVTPEKIWNFSAT